MIETTEIIEVDREKIRQMCLMDDEFFNVCMDGAPDCVELILQIIMDKPDLKVLKVETQRTIANIESHGVRFDVMATSKGKVYDIEVQRADEGAIPKRARYNSYMIGVKELRAGKKYNELPESYVIFITANDVLGDGFPIYHIDRVIRETGKLFKDGDYIIYVNGENRDNTPLGKLMQDFFNTTPSTMNYSTLAKRTQYFKEDETGVIKLTEFARTYYNKGELQGKIEMIIEMLKDNQPLDLIAKFSKFTIEKIKEIAAQNNITISE